MTYHLTEAGRELEPIVQAIGHWGIRWIGELGDEDLDPHLLLWDMHRNIDLEAVPDGRTVVRFTFSDVAPAARQWWLVITAEGVDVCDDDPGYEVQVAVDTNLRALTRIWRGDLDWPRAVRAAEIVLTGHAWARGALPRWLKLSAFAATPRPYAATGVASW